MAVLRLTLTLSIAAAAAAAAAPRGRQPAADPFAFLRPVVTLSPDDLRAIDRGEARVRVLPARGREIAVLAIVAARIDADRLRAWVQRIEAMKKSAAVQAIRRFSSPPVLDDVRSLALPDADLDAIRACRPGDCGLKLSAAEMTRLQTAVPNRTGDWRARLQEAFRALMLDRVAQYRARGHDGIGPYADDDPPTPPAAVFAGLLERSRPLLGRLPQLVDALGAAPPAAAGDAFLYWSVEQFGGKPALSVTDVRVVEPAGDPALPRLIVAGKQVCATHYMNGSLNLTMLLGGRTGGPNYLVYLNRSEVDVVGGLFGGLARSIIQRRVRGEAGEVLAGLRARLESGPPPR
jgi:hypothetical protein